MAMPGDSIEDDDLLYLVLKFLKDQNYVDTAESLKVESGKFFNIDRFARLVINEEWDAADQYIFDVTDPLDTASHFDIILYGLHKLKYLVTIANPEELAKEVLASELYDLGMDFAMTQEEISFLESTNPFSDVDIPKAKQILISNLKYILEEIPCLQDDYQFFRVQNSSLKELVGQRNSGIRTVDASVQGLDATGSSIIPKMITNASQIQLLELPSGKAKHKQQIVRLTYTKSGKGIWALSSNAEHLYWGWPKNNDNLHGKVQVTAMVKPTLVLPNEDDKLINHHSDTHSQAELSCFALSSDESCLASASGGDVSLFNATRFEKIRTMMASPPEATYLAFHPKYTRLIAVGKADSSIEVYSVDADKLITKLCGHTQMITGISFSHSHPFTLVSSGADDQIILWNTQNWKMECKRHLEIPLDRAVAIKSKTEVEFNNKDTELLVVHETHIAIYKASTLECERKWTVHKFSAPIHTATFNCNCKRIYCSYLDGTICVFREPDLVIQCQIDVSAYHLPSFDSSFRRYRNPHAIAAHPTDPKQFAVGVTDGSVYILVPFPSESI